MDLDYPRKGRLKQLYVQDPNIKLKKLVCLWCGDIFREPQRLFCGHTLCKSCFQEELSCAQSRKGNMICNICKAEVNEESVGEDRIAKAFVDEIKVRCSVKKCKWQGLNKDFLDHYFSECAVGQRVGDSRYEYSYYTSKTEFVRKLDDKKQLVQGRPNMMDPLVKTSLREKLDKEWDIQQQFKEDEFRRKTKRLARTFGR